MKISLKSEYALRAVFDLAMHSQGERVKAAGIAGRQSISRKLLELTLTNLRDGGFVSARRGLGGGYCLAKPPDQITVGEILMFFGEIASAKRRSSSPFTELWSRVDNSMLAIVDRITFAELADQWENARGQYIANWQI
jgi:Rrf2 family cysteine metabolism transcriptional repressor